MRRARRTRYSSIHAGSGPKLSCPGSPPSAFEGRMSKTKGAQTPREDERNRDVLIWLNGRLVRRAEAVVSIFDAGFGLGDGVWEGIRLAHGRLVLLDEHLKRLIEGARTIALDIGMDKVGLEAALRETVAANGMHDGAHLRLMVT